MDHGPNWLIKQDGSFWIWGNNQSVPTKISDLSGVAAAYPAGLVVLQDGTIKHWQNDYFTTTLQVESVIGLPSIADVLIWNRTLVADKDGNVYEGQSTAGSDSESGVTYVQVPGIDHVAIMEAVTETRSNQIFYPHLFLKKDGTVWIDNGELKDFMPIHNLTNIVQIAQNYALDKDGTVWTWPNSYSSSLRPSSITASKWSELPGIQLIRHDGRSGLAIDKESRLWFWGGTVTGYSEGWLYDDHPEPVLIKNIKNVKDAYVVEHSLVVLTTDHKVYETTLARSTMPSSPEFKLLASDVASFVGAGRHMIMQKTDGSLLGWGVNKNSELGNQKGCIHKRGYIRKEVYCKQ